ncbi:Polysialic acid transport protein KpsM [Vibrio coralliirubri]|uniref:ABC transporter permease n=1 Tax=Vibrio coralliirubri TaxID=1516159 RepID=UPI0006326EBD|nr:ABC transporter permease [Vibrio coralliirubri]CDT39110.1 Polysialic acid transport protein KpsM [Vibrio coralliirubri]
MAKVLKRSQLKVWRDVIFAIFVREIKSKSKDRLGIAWLVISPVVFIFVFSSIRGRMDGGETHGIPVFFFVAIGMVLVQSFLGMVGSTAASIKKNKPLYAFRQVQPISSVLAISGLELLIKVFVVIVIGVIAYYLGMRMQLADPIEFIFILVRVWIIATSLGVVFSLASCFVPEIEKIRLLIMRPIFFISGIFFSLQDIPREFWPYLTWNPLLHAVELARYAAYPHYGNAGVSYFYLDVCTLTLTFAALVCYQASWKQAISR